MREYTQRDFDSARGAIEQLPDHLSISSESAAVCLGESVHPCAALRIEARSNLSLSLSLFLFFSFPTFLHPILFFFPLYCRGIGNSSARRKNERKIRRSFPCPTTLLSPLSAQFSSPPRETSIFHPGLFLIFLSPSNVHLRERSFAPRRNYSLDLETLKRLLFREGCPIDRERSDRGSGVKREPSVIDVREARLS